MNRFFTLLSLTAALALTASAVPATPEINPASGASALTLLTGAVLVLRSRARR